MRHVFILNPAAGKKQAALKLRPLIEEFFKKYDLPHTVYVTEHAEQATVLVKAELQKGDNVRFYACGGDGTVLEVANGLTDAPNAEVACIPCGSANDFIRFMPHTERFSDLSAQVAGVAKPMDAIACNERLALNLCSMGMDADVAERMKDYKNLPFVSGPAAYNLAIARTFFSPIGEKLRVVMETTEGKIERVGSYLFALAANGQYYGGGYHGSPLSVPDDGLLDFVLVKTLSHLKVLPFLGKYKNGKHLDMDCCETFRGTSMEVFAEPSAVVNADGECFRTAKVLFKILPKRIRFVIPAADPFELLKNYEKSPICPAST